MALKIGKNVIFYNYSSKFDRLLAIGGSHQFLDTTLLTKKLFAEAERKRAEELENQRQQQAAANAGRRRIPPPPQPKAVLWQW